LLIIFAGLFRPAFLHKLLDVCNVSFPIQFSKIFSHISYRACFEIIPSKQNTVNTFSKKNNYFFPLFFNHRKNIHACYVSVTVSIMSCTHDTVNKSRILSAGIRLPVLFLLY